MPQDWAGQFLTLYTEVQIDQQFVSDVVERGTRQWANG